MTTRGELIAAMGARYRQGSRAEKKHILDEFAAVTGYHRKHADAVAAHGRGGEAIVLAFGMSGLRQDCPSGIGSRLGGLRPDLRQALEGASA